MTSVLRVSTSLLLAACMPAAADLYSYVNADGDYVISKQPPKNVGAYVVLSDEGEFIERVEFAPSDVPITHWRPWYLPREPNPMEAPLQDVPAEGTVVIEEIE